MSDLLSGLASISKSVQSTLNSYEIRKISDKVQGYVMNFTEAETKVREATNEDPWGPTGPQMQEIANLTFQYDAFPEVMGMLWKRMFQDNKLAWRRVYKSLILLNHLLKNGSERVVSNARDHLFELRSLESYKYVDERGKDEGINVRHRVKQVMELVQDDEALRGERRKAKTEGKEKYQGFSKEEMLFGNGSKVKSFESWNESNKSKSYSGGFSDDPPSTTGREVTAFDFGDTRHHTSSPELGIREHSPASRSPAVAAEDDDDFGEFAEARSANEPEPKPGFQKSTAIAAAVPPPIPAPGMIASPVKKASQSAGAVSKPRPPSIGGTDDLLGLDFGGPTQASVSSAAPPSQASPLADIFGDVTPAAAPVSHGPAANSANLLDADLFAPNPLAQPISSFQPSYASPSFTPAPVQMDFFGGNPPLASSVQPMFASAASPQYIGGGALITNGQPAQAAQTNGDVDAPKKPTFLNDLTGKLGDDLFNLNLKSTAPKPAPSLNQLQNQQPKTGGSVNLW
ncbi:ENTH domain containing protein [Aphelenchoides avenae]|nr:ENTH domain containing protein [Aphelenchus avenae]